MSQLNNNLPVSQLSIPGTHDTGTYNCKHGAFCESVQCQSWTIYDQLRAGIRFLDIRVDVRSTPYRISHGTFTFDYLTNYLNGIASFLSQNPT